MKPFLLLLFLAACLAASCDWFVIYYYRITVQNNAKDTVVVFTSYSYPDTTMPKAVPSIITIIPSSFIIIDSKEKWQKKLRNKKLSVFYLSYREYKEKGWERMRDEYLVLRRFDLSASELEAKNWIVAYP